jgi:ABC-type nitrate/sulfonate/bicarbonate transport system substrate-binding protein
MPALGDVPTMREQIQSVIYAKPDVIAKRNDMVVAFVHAVGRAEAYLHRNAAQARTLLKAYDPELNDEAINALLVAYLPVLPQQPQIAANNYEKALDFHRITGFAGPSGNAYADVVDASTIIKALHS